LASAARAAGRSPKGWRGVQEVRRRGRAEFELWQTWRTIQAFMSVYGISEEEAVEQYATEADRKRARAVLGEMRGRISVYGPNGWLFGGLLRQRVTD